MTLDTNNTRTVSFAIRFEVEKGDLRTKSLHCTVLSTESKPFLNVIVS